MFDLHTHTTFSDGRNSPEEMVLSAIDRGLSVLGISDHSYTSFDERYCIPRARLEEYKTCIHSLREKYRNRIGIALGLEKDYYSDTVDDGYDYLIGSVHYIKLGGEYIPVDESAQILIDAAVRHCGGDLYSLAEIYYNTVSDVIHRTNADIIGHFDLFKKFNRDGSLFDERAPRYKKAVIDATDRLLAFDVPFEVNTGAISRGYRDDLYPSPEIIGYIKARGGKLILSSDSHAANSLCFAFGQFADSIQPKNPKDFK